MQVSVPKGRKQSSFAEPFARCRGIFLWEGIADIRDLALVLNKESGNLSTRVASDDGTLVYLHG